MSNDFNEQLEDSKTIDDKFWGPIYKRAFPDVIHISRGHLDGQPQRMGIDAVLVLSSMKTIYIDEKCRWRHDPMDQTTDIMLEYVSVDTTGALGWVEKPLMCDYIAYAFLHEKTAYFLPVPQLQAAWKRCRKQWLQKYKTIPVQNNTYRTLCCPVPYVVLQREMINGQLDVMPYWHYCPPLELPDVLFEKPTESEIAARQCAGQKWVNIETDMLTKIQQDNPFNAQIKKAISDEIARRQNPIPPTEATTYGANHNDPDHA